MALGKGIPVINGFDLNSKLPLDSRAVADTMEDMNALVTNGSVGDGQLCYCKADKKLYVLKNNVWGEVGGSGGASVSPTLWLVDGHTQEVRTTITEEEYNNLVNGLYNQVLYNTEDDFFSTCSPSKLFSMGREYGFVQFKIVANADETFSYSSMVARIITIGEKNASNEYPITIEDVLTINPPSSSSGGSSSLNIVTIDSFNSGEHNQQGFVMPTEDVVLFTDGSGTSLIGYKKTRDNITSYYCYEWKPEIDGKLKTYKNLLYKISEINIGFKIETIDISQQLNYNLMFLPGYSASDNGKVLSVVNGEAQWANAGDSGGGGDSSKCKLVLEYGYIETGGFPQDDTVSVSASFKVAIDLLEYISMETIIVYATGEDNPVMFNVAKDRLGHKYNSVCFSDDNSIYFYYLTEFELTSVSNNKYSVAFKVRRKTIPTSTNTITFEN